MKIFLVLAALVAVAVAAPAAPAQPEPIPILQYDEQRDDHGQFSLMYKTGNGITVTRQGSLKPTADEKDLVLVQSGSHEYTGPDGIVYRLTWTADEEGYRAVADHLPVGPSA